MNIPRDFIDLLLTRIDIVELINTYVPLRKKSGSNYFARCPFHNEKSASFSVSQPKQFYYCFGCGAHGNALDFVMQHEHFNFPEAIESLAQLAGMELPREHSPVLHGSKDKDKDVSLPMLYEVMQQAAAFYYDQMCHNKRAINYLKSRGINGAIAKRFNIGYAREDWSALLDHLLARHHTSKVLLEAGLIIKKQDGHGAQRPAPMRGIQHFYDRFRDRIIFPILDPRGRVIGFGGRIIGQGEPKYLNSPETPLFQKGRELYGLYHALKSNRKLKSIIIVEGYMDVIALFQHGITNAVATLGTATTAHHINRLLRYTHEIIFCFDGDQAGRTAAWRAVQTLLPLMHDEMQVRFLFLPDGEDPDTLIRKQGKEAFNQLLAEAQSLSLFFLQTLAKENEMESIEGRARFAATATQYINQIPSSMYRTILLQEISKRARIDINDLKLQPGTTVDRVRQVEQRSHSASTFMLKKRASHKTKVMSPMRSAITLLIQNPQLIENITDSLPHLNFPGASFFAELIAIIQKDPHITTGRLIEYWRDRKEGKYIAALANMEQIVPEKGIKNEFLGAIKKLTNLGLQAEIDRLLAKAANIGLTQDEKEQLSTWIGKNKAIHEENR